MKLTTGNSLVIGIMILCIVGSFSVKGLTGITKAATVTTETQTYEVAYKAGDASSVIKGGPSRATTNQKYQTLGGLESTETWNGWHFIELQIPQDAVITTAKLDLYSKGIAGGSDFPISMYGEATDHSDLFHPKNGPQERKLTKTILETTITPQSWNEKEGFGAQPLDVTSIIQEIVARTGREQGNSLTLIAKNEADNPGFVAVSTTDQSELHGAQLTIEFELIDEPVDVPVDEPVDETIDVPVDVPVDEPIDEPIDVPVDEPVDEPIDVPVDQPVDEPVKSSIDEPVDEPVDQPIDVPVDEPIDVPVDEPVDEPVKSSIDEPVDQPIDVPVDEPIDVPVDEPIDVPVDEPIDVPVDEPIDVPVDEPIDVPVDEPIDKGYELMGRIYPGNPACNAPDTYTQTTFETLKPEYFTVNTNGQLIFLTEEKRGCNGFSTRNISDIKAHSERQFVTVSAGLTATRELTQDGVNSAIAIETLANFVEEHDFDGVEIDFEGFGGQTQEDYEYYKIFLEKLRLKLHANNRKLMLDIPYIHENIQHYYELAYEDFSGLVDEVVIMMYDMHYDYSNGTSISTFDMMEKVITWGFSQFDENTTLVLGVPNFAYYGVPGLYKPIHTTYEELIELINISKPERMDNSSELRFYYDRYVFVYHDQTAVQEKIEFARSLGIEHISLRHLGGNPVY